MGHRQITYELTNVSRYTCVVHSAPTGVNLSNGQKTITTVGSTIFTPNGPDQWIILEPGRSAVGQIEWSTRDQPVGAPYTLGITLPDVGPLTTGYHDSVGARDNAYTVTNLTPKR